MSVSKQKARKDGVEIGKTLRHTHEQAEMPLLKGKALLQEAGSCYSTIANLISSPYWLSDVEARTYFTDGFVTGYTAPSEEGYETVTPPVDLHPRSAAHSFWQWLWQWLQGYSEQPSLPKDEFPGRYD